MKAHAGASAARITAPSAVAGWHRMAKASAGAVARNQAMVANMCEMSPRQLRQFLTRLEAEGHLVSDDETDEIPVTEDDEDRLESEISLADEDLPFDDSPTPIVESTQSIVLGEQDPAPSFGDASDDTFELVVVGERCAFTSPAWALKRPRTGDGGAVVFELSRWFRVFHAMADWLTTERGRFLVTGDLWDLGCSAFEDIRKGRVPVLQGKFLQGCLTLEPKPSEESFSRYIRHCRIRWPDGTAPVSCLFDDDTRMAWVASAIRQFAVAHAEILTPSVLAEYASVTRPGKRTGKHRLLSMSVDTMDLPTIIERANLLGDTRWRDVLTRWQLRIIQDEA